MGGGLCLTAAQGGAYRVGQGGSLAFQGGIQGQLDLGFQQGGGVGAAAADGASGDTAFFKKHSNINGFRTPEQRNYLYSALLKPSISAAIARFISR